MNFGMPELIVVLLIAALIFGTRKLRSMGSDLGGAVRGFRKAVSDEEKAAAASADATPVGEQSGEPSGDTSKTS